ncbi:MAG: hypothetical protein SWQ30_23270 [Thermodesulfobacteriota bacterium]|nr:hypothetical protein [Thermodesulfobacteriota bacterium]
MIQTYLPGFHARSIDAGERLYRYHVYLPPQYDAGEKWPVILFLHGAGEVGYDTVKPLGVGIGTAIMR